MKILMIGGTGIISTGVTRHLLDAGADVWLLNRGHRPDWLPLQAHVLTGDRNDGDCMAALLASQHFDAVVDWTVYTPAQAIQSIALFRGKTDQYVFISSASAYQRPARHHVITERTPLENSFSAYARDKAACEAIFLKARADTGFPATIVRPSLTYGDFCIPYVMNSWHKPWSLIDRMRTGKRIIVPGDGTSLWEITHNSDFAFGLSGLLGRSEAIGEAFHITSGEVMTWEQILLEIADAAGVAANVTHISSEFICAFLPEETGGLIGDKISSVIFDNSKIKGLVPAYEAKMPFREGIARTLSFLGSHPAYQEVDEAWNRNMDRVIAAHDAGMAMARL